MNKKQILSLLLALLILLGAIIPIVNAEDETESVVTEAAGEYFKNDVDEDLNGNVYGGMEKLMEESGGGRVAPADNFSYLFYRLIGTGVYIDNIKGAHVGDKEYVDPLYKDRENICGIEPNNLLSHNCDVPNALTELIQNTIGVGDFTGIKGGEKTSAKTNFGIPANIPGGSVPLNIKSSSFTYTPLERFGYDLKYTKYAGEWDHIIVRSQGRSLSSFGFWGKVKLFGSAFFTGIGRTVNTFFKEATLNPLTWIPSFKKALEAGASATLLKIINTFDANIIFTHKWARPHFAKTVYGAYYLSDQQVQQRAEKAFDEEMQRLINKKLGENSKYSKLIAANPSGGNGVPSFVYDEKRETEESKAARNEWNIEYTKRYQQTIEIRNAVINECLIAHGSTSADTHYMSLCHDIANKDNRVRQAMEMRPKPEPVYMSKEDQFKEFLTTDNVKNYRNKMSEIGVNVPSDGTPENWLNSIISSYNETYKKEGVEGGEIFDTVLKESKEDYFKNNITHDVNKEISHWVCYLGDKETPDANELLNPNITPLLYSKHNGNNTEYISTKCSGVITRPPVKGGYLADKSTDTRWQRFKETQESDANKLGISNGGLSTYLTKVLAKITNEILSFSYENIVTKLKIDTVMENIMTTVRDSLFAPLLLLGLALSAIWIFIKVAYQRSLLLGIKSLLILAVVATLGTAFISDPGRLIGKIDEIGNKTDLFVSELVLANDPNEICYASGDSAGVRAAQCQIWYNTVYLPWSFGQWGVAPSKLDNDRFTNTNNNLVGNGTVHFGNNITKNNWGLYQLSKMKSGTITTDDKNVTKAMSKDLYKIVDLQFGPSGSGYDSRYAQDWANGSSENGILSLLLSIAILVGIGGMSLAKIEATVAMIFYTGLLPFTLVRAIFPGGEGKIREWFFTMFGLFIKRIFIIVFMGITLRLLYSVGNANLGTYTTVGISLIGVMIVCILQWKSFVKAVLGNMDPGFDNLSKNAVDSLPPVAKYRLKHFSETVIGSSAGFLGGTIAGIQAATNKNLENPDGTPNKVLSMNSLKTIVNYAREGSRTGSAKAQSRNRRKQRREGFGIIDTVDQITDGVIQDAADSLSKTDMSNEARLIPVGEVDDGLELLAINNPQMAGFLGVVEDPDIGMDKFDVQRKLSEIFSHDIGLQKKVRQYAKKAKKSTDVEELKKISDEIFSAIGMNAEALNLFEDKPQNISDPNKPEIKEIGFTSQQHINIKGRFKQKEQAEIQMLEVAGENIMQYNDMLVLQKNYRERMRSDIKQINPEREKGAISDKERELYAKMYYEQFNMEMEELIQKETNAYRNELIENNEELQDLLDKQNKTQISFVKRNLDKEIANHMVKIEKEVKNKELEMKTERESYKEAFYQSLHNDIFKDEKDEQIKIDNEYSKMEFKAGDELVGISDLMFDGLNIPEELSVDFKNIKLEELNYALDSKYNKLYEAAANGNEEALKIVAEEQEKAIAKIDGFTGFAPGTTQAQQKYYLEGISRQMGWDYEKLLEEKSEEFNKDLTETPTEEIQEKEYKEIEKNVDSIEDIRKEQKSDKYNYYDKVKKHSKEKLKKYSKEDILSQMAEWQIQNEDNHEIVSNKRSKRELLLEIKRESLKNKQSKHNDLEESIQNIKDVGKEELTPFEKLKSWTKNKINVRTNKFTTTHESMKDKDKEMDPEERSVTKLPIINFGGNDEEED